MMGGQATLNRIGRRPRGRPIRSSFLLSLSLSVCLSSLLPRFSQMSERTTGDARERLRRSEEETAKARAELARRQDSHERAAREAEQKFRRVEMEREEYKRKFSDLGK